MSSLESFITIVGLAAITVGTRCFFLISDRELVLPAWVQRGLRYAPLAALAAVIVPEVVMLHGEFIDSWRDARLFAVAAGATWFYWRRTILGTILTGMAVLVPMKLLLGW